MTQTPVSEGLMIAINSCKDVTSLGRFSKSVDAVRWVAQLQAHLEKITILHQPADAQGLVRELVDTLAFYANPSDYKAPYTGGGGTLYHDCGEKAKAAIAKANTYLGEQP